MRYLSRKLSTRAHVHNYDLGVDSVLQQCLAEPTIASAIVRSKKTRTLDQDWATTLEVAKQHQSLRYIVCSDSLLPAGI